MKKILIVTWVPIYLWDYKRLDLNTLEKKFEIIIYDVSNIYFKKINLKKIYKKEYLVKTNKFLSLKDFCKEIRKLKIDLIINKTGAEKSHPIYKEMEKKNVKIIKFVDTREFLCMPYAKKLFYFFKYILKKISINFKKKTNEVSIISGNNFMNNFYSLGHEKFLSHSINYDYFLRKKTDLKIKKNKKVATYLDTGYHFHPDFKIHSKINKKFDIKNFSNKINHLFFILKKMGYEIYFLSHPKISKKKQLIYKNCKKIDFKTYEYVKISDLVITTHSSTIDYPIILKKKILRIFSKEFKSYPVVEEMYKNSSKFFENNGLNLDNINELTKKKIDEATLLPDQKYEKYLYKFIKDPKSKNKIFSDVISGIIK